MEQFHFFVHYSQSKSTKQTNKQSEKVEMEVEKSQHAALRMVNIEMRLMSFNK